MKWSQKLKHTRSIHIVLVYLEIKSQTEFEKKIPIPNPNGYTLVNNHYTDDNVHAVITQFNNDEIPCEVPNVRELYTDEESKHRQKRINKLKQRNEIDS